MPLTLKKIRAKPTIKRPMPAWQWIQPRAMKHKPLIPQANKLTRRHQPMAMRKMPRTTPKPTRPTRQPKPAQRRNQPKTPTPKRRAPAINRPMPLLKKRKQLRSNPTPRQKQTPMQRMPSRATAPLLGMQRPLRRKMYNLGMLIQKTSNLGMQAASPLSL